MYSKQILSLLKSEKISFGDRVKVTEKSGKENEGILMPRVMGDADTLIIKLDNGYNIGVKPASVKILGKNFGKAPETSDVSEMHTAFPHFGNKEISKISETSEVRRSKISEKNLGKKLEQKSGLPEISILTTGGTISSRIDYATGGVISSLSPGEILSSVPELAEIVRLKNVRELFRIFSENMTPAHWKKMAEEAAHELNSGAEGVIIFHGTDTMGYSAAALSFMLRGLTKPVVFTGAQRSTDRGSSDTAFNVICSAYAARSDIAGVGLCMHGESADTYCLLNRGTKVRKMHTSERNTFRPINDLPIAKIWPSGRIEKTGTYVQKINNEIVADTKFEDKVALLKAYPGSNPELIDFLVKKKYRGIVVEATGLGHVPNDWMPHIKKAIDKGVVVAFAAQTLYGRLNPFVYESARRAHELGVVYCEDMLPETAYVKLGWVLGHTKNPDEAKKMMLASYAGEITERTDAGTFLY